MANIYFTRAIQPENNQPHFLAKALIVDATGKILVLERSSTHPLFPHGADLPGGQVEPGETPLEAVRREIEEETGLGFAPSQLSVAFEHILPHPDGQRLSYMCYAALVDGDAPEITLSWEHSSYQWLTPDDFMQQPITPQTDYPFAAAVHYINSLWHYAQQERPELL
jgi:hydrolase, NUDIX family